MSVHLLSIIDPLWPLPRPTQSQMVQTQAEELTGEMKKVQSEMVSSTVE